MVKFYYLKLQPRLRAANRKKTKGTTPSEAIFIFQRAILSGEPSPTLVRCNYEKQTVCDSDVDLSVNVNTRFGGDNYGG